jgi:hypothetical protein
MGLEFKSPLPQREKTKTQIKFNGRIINTKISEIENKSQNKINKAKSSSFKKS